MAAHRVPRRRRFVAARRRAALAAVLAVALIAAATGVALAYFTGGGSGVAAADVATLGAPGGVGGASTPGTGVVAVSWTASGGALVPTGYLVSRIDSTHTRSPACGTSVANPATGTSCTDSAVPVGSYTYTVTALFRTWTAQSVPSADVAVSRADQAITFTSTPITPMYGGSYTVAAAGGASGQPVTFSAATPSVCTVTGSAVSFVGVGTCTIDADQAASSYFNAAPTKAQTFTVAPQTQSIVYTSTAPTDATVDGTGYPPTATGGGSGNAVTFSVATPALCTITGGLVTFQHVGTCTIDANQAGSTDYAAANQVQQSIAVGQGAQAVTFTSTPPSPATVGGGYAVTATGGASGNTVTFSVATPSVCSVSGGVVAFQHVGTCLVDADQAGNADYLAAGQVQQSVTVGQGAQTITFTSTPPDPATAGSTYGLSATGGASGQPVTFSSGSTSVCTVSGTTATFVAAGSCLVNADQAGNADYTAAPTVQQTITVTAVVVFGFTSRSSGPPQNTTVLAGAGASAGATITVYICNNTQASCLTSTDPETTIAATDGTWSVTFSKLGNGSHTYTVQAKQTAPALISPVLVFTT